jgi:hypothetical protein
VECAAQIPSNAVAQAFSLAPGLYHELARVCRTVVGECAAVPSLPREGWSAPTSGEAAALAVRSGREADWAQLVRIGDRWDACHEASASLRETGTLTGQLMFNGPTSVCVQSKNWEAALEGLPAARRLPGALRLPAAIDRAWLPGLYLASDHTAAVEGKPESRVPAESVTVATEFG